MVEQNGKEDQFNHNVYFLATMLDPQFGLKWVDLDVTNNESPDLVKNFREDLKRTLILHLFYSEANFLFVYYILCILQSIKKCSRHTIMVLI